MHLSPARPPRRSSSRVASGASPDTQHSPQLAEPYWSWLHTTPRRVRYTNAISAAPSLLHLVSIWIVLK